MAWCLLLLVAIACRGATAQECPLLIPSFREAQSKLSTPSTLHLYTTPFDSQCTGSISEVEFCYRPRSATGRLFTVVILRQMGNGAFEVVSRSHVSADPGTDNCTTDPHIATVERCCTTRRLEPVIDITEGNVYAIEAAAAGTGSCLLLIANISRAGVSVPADVGDMLPAVPSPSNILVAMVRFITSAMMPPPDPPQPTPTLFPTGGDTGPTSVSPVAAAPSTRTAPQEPTSTRTQPQSSAGPPAEQGGDFDPVPVGIGVALGFLVAIIVVIVAVIVAVIVVQRRRKKKDAYSVQPSQGEGFTNAIYTAGVSGKKQSDDTIELNMKVGRPNSYSSDPKQDPELPHEYAMPDEIRGAKIIDSFHEYSYATTETSKDKMATPSNEYSYATTEVRGTKRQRSMSKEEVIYQVPAKDENSLYAQFERIRVQQIQRDTVKTTDYLGSGQFGTVTRGEWESPDGPLEVAIKTLKTDAAQTDKVKFLQEAAIMGQFQHSNAVTLHGVVLSGEPVMIVLELLTKGDLREHLISLCPEPGKKVDYLEHTLLSFCRQIAFGMDYLSQKAFVHRDLAARNILVAEDDMCKVADFGMSRDLVDENYYISSGGKIPVKWTAPEAIHFKKYSTASDVWSYGAVMYEIWSLGHKPFEGYTNSQAIKLIDGGFRLPPPPGCPKAIYELMIKCWHQKTSERPSFTTIVQWLSRPDPQLLRWSEEDRAVHPEASLLGAEMEAAAELYKELQNTYIVDLADQ